MRETWNSISSTKAWHNRTLGYYEQTPPLTMEMRSHDKVCKWCKKKWSTTAVNAVFCKPEHRVLWIRARKAGGGV